MIKSHIYLDYNATTPLHPSAWAIMKKILENHNTGYNASSIHYFGRKAHQYLEDAREHVANLIGAESNQVIFNSGATEGNNTIITHFAKIYPNENILIAEGQHPSIMKSQQIFNNIKTIPIDSNGIVKYKELETLLQNNKVSLVSCIYAHNETGVIQDVSKLSEITHKHGALLHCDTVQAAGKIPVNIKKSGIDFATISSHKIGGPQGSGALIIGICGQTPSLLFGGGQEQYLRAGTQNTASIAGFGAAAKTALENLDKYQQLAIMRDNFEDKLKDISPNIIIHCKNTNRTPNTSFFSLPNIKAQNILIALDLEGIAISNGSACSSGTVRPIYTLQSMGLSEEIASNALRISMGWATKDSDIDRFLNEWKKIIPRINKK